MPAWIFVVLTTCGTLIFLVAVTFLWKVYKRDGAPDVREFAKALRDLRPLGAVVSKFSERRQPPELSSGPGAVRLVGVLCVAAGDEAGPGGAPAAAQR